jgi:hypothetical protein
MNKFAYVILVSIILLGCEKDGEVVSSLNDKDIKIYVIDNCEYIGDVRGGSRDFLTHKGNCKFCVERSKINCK